MHQKLFFIIKLLKLRITGNRCITSSEFHSKVSMNMNINSIFTSSKDNTNDWLSTPQSIAYWQFWVQMTKQRAEINGSGAKIRSIAEFLINGANGSFTHLDRKRQHPHALSDWEWNSRGQICTMNMNLQFL